jgi:hypothetical protein
MFSDFQDFFWLVFGDLLTLSVFATLVISIIALVIIVLDRAFTNLLTGGGDRGI